MTNKEHQLLDALKNSSQGTLKEGNEKPAELEEKEKAVDDDVALNTSNAVIQKEGESPLLGNFQAPINPSSSDN